MGREGGSDDVCYKPVANSGACELSYPDGITHECRKRFITVVTSSETPTGDVLDLSDAFVSWCPHDDDAERVILALHEIPVHGGPQNRGGHSAVAAVRNLLRFGGDCHDCDARHPSRHARLAYSPAKQGSWLSLFPWLPCLPCGIDVSRIE